MVVSAVFIRIDQACDWIPVVSTVSNLTDLFLRSLPPSCLPERLTTSRYWEHIQTKDRSWSLLIPVWNVVYCTFRCFVQPLIDSVRALEEAIEQRSRANQRAREANQNLRLEIEAGWQEYKNKKCELWGLLACSITPPMMKISDLRAFDLNQEKLYKACLLGTREEVEALLDSGMNPNFYCYGSTPLSAACKKGDPEAVGLLLERGARIWEPNLFGAFPVSLACARGNLEVVRCFFPNQRLAEARIFLPMQKGVQVSLSDIAHYGGHPEIVEYLEGRGAPSPDITLPKEQFKSFFSCCEGFD